MVLTAWYLSSRGPRPWEDGYEEWFWKNERQLRQSGIGADNLFSAHSPHDGDDADYENYPNPNRYPHPDLTLAQAQTDYENFPDHSPNPFPNPNPNLNANPNPNPVDDIPEFQQQHSRNVNPNQTETLSPILFPGPAQGLGSGLPQPTRRASAAPWALSDDRESETDFNRRL